MWDLVARLFNSIPSNKSRALAKQVLEASLDEAKQLVADEVTEMSLAEARGYVRARCGLIVRRQARLVISRDHEADSSWAAAVARSAIEQLVPVVIRDLKVGIPRRMELRAAA